jgi:hypothetical protein
VEGDARSRLVAVVADRFVNPGDSGVDGLGVLEKEGWGVIQLPPASYPASVRGALLEHVAEAVEEFLRHGYTIAAVGIDARAKRALAAAGLPPLPAANPRTADALHAFLRKTATSTPS